MASLVNAYWYDHYFGYPCALPTNIYLDGLKVYKYEASVDENGNRTENIIGENQSEVNFFLPDIAKYTDRDISRYVSEGGEAENNPYKAPENLYISNVGDVDLRFPETPMFRDMKINRS